MNTVNNANLLNLMLNLGNLTDAAGTSLDLATALRLPQGVDIEGLSPEMLEQLGSLADGLDFQQLMQQGMQPGVAQKDLSESDLQDVIRLDFRLLDADDAETEEVPLLSDVVAEPVEGMSENPETEGELSDSTGVLASLVIPEEAGAQVGWQPRDNGLSSSISAVGTDRSPRQAAAQGGESLPQQGQIASGPTAKAPLPEGVESFVLPEEPSDAAFGKTREPVALATGTLPSRKDALDSSRAESSTDEGRILKADADEVDTESDEEDAFVVDRNKGREEPRSRLDARAPVSGDMQRSEAPAASRVDAQAQAPVVASAANRIEGMDGRGMNDLPAEMKTLHLSPRAGEAAWGREMGDRIGFLLHNNLKQAEIRLDPPHLGKLDIQLQVQDDKAIVHIQAQTAQTRDLLDASLMRLRDALQDAGYSQVDVNVSQREHSMAQGEGGGSEQGGSAGSAGPDGIDAEALPAGMSRHEIELTARMQGRIDYFA